MEKSPAQKGFAAPVLGVIIVIILALILVYIFSNKSPTSTLLNIASSIPQSTVSKQSTAPTASASGQITFDNFNGQDTPLNGQFPNGVVDWGAGNWMVSAPRGAFTSKSLTFNGDGVNTASFRFVNNATLTNLDLYNGGTNVATVTLSCTGQDDKQVLVQPDQSVNFDTGWTQPCSQVTFNSSNGWNVNFNNLSYK